MRKCEKYVKKHAIILTDSGFLLDRSHRHTYNELACPVFALIGVFLTSNSIENIADEFGINIIKRT